MTLAGMVIDPGALAQGLRFERIVERTPDGAGGYEEVWDVLANGGDHVWGALDPLTGNELIRAQQARSNATHVCTIRWRDDVDALCRVIFEGNIYEIIEPPRAIPDHRNTHLRFQVRVEPKES